MQCPYCDFEDTKVIAGRILEPGGGPGIRPLAIRTWRAVGPRVRPEGVRAKADAVGGSGTGGSAGGKITSGLATPGPRGCPSCRIARAKDPPGGDREPSSAPFDPGSRPALLYLDFSEEESSEYVTDRPSETEEVEDEMLPFA